MNMSEPLSPSRPLAQHCGELTQRGPRPEERAEQLAIWRRDLARELASDLGDLLAGARLSVTIGEPEMLEGQMVLERIGKLAANCLLRCGASDRTVLFSFDVETAIALTDRSFGGSGEPVLDIVETLPRSAALLVEQAGRICAQAIVRISADGESRGACGDVIVRSESAKRLKPFPMTESCVLLPFEMRASDGNAWTGKLAMPCARLDSLLPGLRQSSGMRAEPAARPDRRAAALGGIPLPIEAILAEFDLSLARLEQLAPGDCLPLTIARDVPVRIGKQTIARGHLGTREDRLALRLTETIKPECAQ